MSNSFACAKTVLLPLCLLFLLSGCYKLQDYLHHPGDNTYDDCTIKKIVSVNGGSSVTFTFTYNKPGTPASIVNERGGTGLPNYYFTYDKKNRLTQFLKSSTNGFYESWTKYVLDEKGTIIRDTTFFFGQLSGTTPLPTTNNIFYTRYEYDADGRIVHTRTDRFLNGTVSIIFDNTYNYDVNGNLEKGDGTVYDKKLNLKRTNAVWMFITKDYSVNNPFTATSYNASSLPLKFTQTDLVPSAFQDVTVSYSCK